MTRAQLDLRFTRANDYMKVGVCPARFLEMNCTNPGWRYGARTGGSKFSENIFQSSFHAFDFSLCSDRGCNRAAASRGPRVDVHFQPTKHTVKPPCGSSRSYVVPSLLFIRPWMLFRRLPLNSAAK